MQYPAPGGQYPKGAPKGAPGMGGQPGMMGGQPGMMGGQPGMMGGAPGMMGGQPGMMGGMGAPGMMGGAPGMSRFGQGNQQYHQNNWYAMYYNQISPQELQGLQQWFQGVDRDRSGAIDAMELSQAQFPHGRPFDQITCGKLIKVFDVDYSGSLSFYEFAALWKYIGSLLAAFQHCDRDRSFTLDPSELHLALAQAGFQVDQEMVRPLLYRYSRAGHVSFDAFVALSVQLAHIRHTYQQYSGGAPMIQLTYPQFMKGKILQTIFFS